MPDRISASGIIRFCIVKEQNTLFDASADFSVNQIKNIHLQHQGFQLK